MDIPINLKRLAKDLNLSVSTVSKALHDSYEISPDTKKRVLELAKKLNYIPNPYASGLRKKKSKTIAVVIPEVADNFFSQAIHAIETVAQERGYHVLIYLSHESYDKEKAILQDFRNGRVDGVLMSVSGETTSTDHIEDLTRYAIPVVLFDRVLPRSEFAKITTNDYESAFLAVRHLIEAGCRKIAFLSISPSLSINQDRLKGYQAALEEYKLEVAEHFIVDCTHYPNRQSEMIKNLLTQPLPPDGIMASVEKLAFLTYQVCVETGIRIPNDLKVICFSNLEIASLLNPSLTTITQPAFEMGNAAATTLFRALDNKIYQSNPENLEIPSILFPRGSTA